MYQQLGYTVNPIPGNRILVSDVNILWHPGSAFPAPGTGHIISIPFTFTLPSVLPPSMHVEHGLGTGSVRYGIEVEGQRPGLLKRNRRIRQMFPLLPTDEQGHQVRQQLQNGTWTGGWKSFSGGDLVKRLPWQDPASINAYLQLPDMASFPLSLPIPFRLRAFSSTRPMKKSDAEKKQSQDKTIFPAPPDASDLKLELRVQHHVKSDSILSADFCRSQDLLKGQSGNLQEKRDPPSVSNPHKDLHTVEQQTYITGTFFLKAIPSFAADILAVEHTLKLKVPFSGPLNKVDISVPITITSGMVDTDLGSADYEMLPAYYSVVDVEEQQVTNEKKK